jgi:hypothetical protein
MRGKYAVFGEKVFGTSFCAFEGKVAFCPQDLILKTNLSSSSWGFVLKTTY